MLKIYQNKPVDLELATDFLRSVVLKIKTAPDFKRCLPFNENNVAVGNLKDPEKIAAKISSAKESYASEGALLGVTGRIASITVMCTYCGGAVTFKSFVTDNVGIAGNEEELDNQERIMLTKFFDMCKRLGDEAINSNVPVNLISWGGSSFDIPFLLQRSCILKVYDVYKQIFIPDMEQFYYFGKNRGVEGNVRQIDLMDFWNCSKYYSPLKKTTLQQLAYSFGYLEDAVLPEVIGRSEMRIGEGETAMDNIISEKTYKDFCEDFKNGIDQIELSKSIVQGDSLKQLYPLLETYIIQQLADQII